MFTIKALTGILFLVLAQFNTARAYDSLVYRSSFESQLVYRTVNGTNPDYFSLFLAINSDSASSQLYSVALNGFYQYFDRKVSAIKDRKQKARVIFEEVHSRFFRQYVENVLFEKIFEDGRYNCLTASMLYALVLDRYHIPYAIKEKPAHIYLVAFPGAENILFETTNPRGLYAPDEKSKREYVQGLVALKLVTQEHVNTVGTAKAFNEYYYNSEDITLRQLAGLQYFNLTLALYQEEDINGAIASAMKADLLYPNTRNQQIKTSLLREALDNAEFESLVDVRHLAELASTSADVSERRHVLRAFGNLLDVRLIKNGDFDFLADAYKIIAGRAEDETLKLEIRYNYELAVAHWHAMKGDMDQALAHAGDAHTINAEDARLHELIARAIILKTERMAGKPNAIETLHAYRDKFPFLKSNKTFNALMVYQYSFKAYGLFLENSGDEGYRYLALMEDRIKELNGHPMALESMIGMAYAEAGAYHYRKKQFIKAKEVLQKGLDTAPGHGEIQERLRIVENELKR